METISLDSIYAPHEVTDAEKLAALIAGMEADGWQGRPLLLLEVGDAYQAITGSHRIAAAKAIGLEEVPAIIINSEAFYGAGYEPTDMWDDDVRLSILKEIGDTAAAELMQAEIDANNA
jgi:hypothetical protein